MGAQNITHVVIVVLGDIGRSPRMVNHACELARYGALVTVLAYIETEIPTILLDHPNIQFIKLANPRFAKSLRAPRFVFILYALLRLSITTISLLSSLFTIKRPNYVLVQNPPAIPTLAVATLAAKLRGAQLVIDWHNYGYSMLRYRLGLGHPLVRLAEWHEQSMGNCADHHFCVSGAMRADLIQRWQLREPAVLYDQPSTALLIRRRDHTDLMFLSQRSEQLSQLLKIDPPLITPTTRVLLSSTSWSADEDFSLLFDALVEYDTCSEHSMPQQTPTHLMMVLTGNGPLREHYEAKFASQSFRHVTVLIRWLPYDDYLTLLTLIDLGLCFHRSSSAVDLPMKILDFYGAGAPVCAFDYGPCIRELVNPGITGYLFQTGAQLADKLIQLCANSEAATQRLYEMRASVIAQRTHSWSDEWRKVASSVFKLSS